MKNHSSGKHVQASAQGRKTNADKSCFKSLIRSILIATFALTGQLSAADRPNIVLIMTDNHGDWTLGCYGNHEIRTPNIDRLASEGVLMNRAFSSNPVCSPTRATFLTGLMPSQHGVHCFLRSGRLQTGPAARNTLDEFESLPELLKQHGYRCGLVGKWHLGGNQSPQESFEDYWITMPHGATSTFYGAEIIENGRIRTEPTYLTDFWTDHAERFIRQSSDHEEPFFLFLAYNGPYGLGRLLLREGQNRHAGFYAEQTLTSFPNEAIHPWQYSNRDYINNPVSLARVATEVSGIDDGVGRIMATLKELELDESTLIIFVADQGWVGGHGGFFGMGDHTRPVTARDGMMKIPMLFRQPGFIQSGVQSDLMVSNYDLVPTLRGLLDIAPPTAEQPTSPGRDFSGLLTTGALDNPSEWEAAVYYEFEGLRCIRTVDWKLVRRYPHGPDELYDLVNDPGEMRNLVADSAVESHRHALEIQLERFFEQYSEERFDLWNGGGSQTVLFEPPQDISQRPDATPPPRLPENFQPQVFQLPDGFEAELVAGPPLVRHPMMACFDDRGRLYVAESAGENLRAADLEERLPNMIRRLEDRDGDGRFDRSTVFADRMTLPQGAVWHDGALYVASPPNIWRLVDKDDDGVADQREILVDRFGYTGNAASVHGCFAGPDGRLYWCDGRHGHEFRDEDGNLTSQRSGSYIFSVRPDGSDVRIHCGGGMDNPVEVDFMSSGEMLGTVNILYSRPRQDCLVHWLYGGAYPHSERVLGEMKKTGDLLGPVHDFGHVAVSGMTRYRSGTLEPSFRDNLFVTQFNTGRIQRIQLNREGATFQSEAHEFLQCNNRDFHPTDVLEDADGSLLVVDTGGWFLLGCPTSQLAKPQISGGIYRIARTHSTPIPDPRGLNIDWDGLTAARLGRLLNDPRHTVRDRCIREFVRRGSESVDVLSTISRRRDSRERLAATWALGQIEEPEARAAVISRLNDSQLEIRLAAAHILANQPDIRGLSALRKALNDSSPFLRAAAARALGRLGEASAVPDLLSALGSDMDRSENHALVYALIEINNVQQTRHGLNSDNPRVRSGALIALDQMDAGDLSIDDLTAALAEGHRDTTAAVANILDRRPEWSSTAVDLLILCLRGKKPEALPNPGLLARCIPDSRLQSALCDFLEAAVPSDPRQAWIRAGFSLSSNVTAGPRLADWLKGELQSADPDCLEDRLILAGRIVAPECNPILEKLSLDSNQSPDLRLHALRALSTKRDPIPEARFHTLTELLEDKMTTGVRHGAAELLGNAPLTARQLQQLNHRLIEAGPAELRHLIRPFVRAPDSDSRIAFLTSLEQARSFHTLPMHEFSDIIKRFPAEQLEQANQLLDQLRDRDARQATHLEEISALLPDGDPQRGREIFMGSKSRCTSCHRIGQNGVNIGPDLSRIGRIRSHRDLLEAIVYPSASIVRDYESQTIVMRDGRTVSGLIIKDESESFILQQQTGEPRAIPHAQVDQVQASPVSVMPLGFHELLSSEELADLIAYLLSLK